jgi:NAD+ synthase (glutamine-hydrolysing)
MNALPSASSPHPFDSLYTHGFARASVCIPVVSVADPVTNADRTLELAREASDDGAALAIFPELGISAYTCDDLFQQDALLDAVRTALQRIVEASRELTPVLLVGAPLRFEDRLFNCAVAVYRGRILGIQPKTYQPNYREYYEKRQFASSRDASAIEVMLLGQTVPFGTDLVYHAENVPGLAIHAEVCEDVWVPLPPSTFGALAGATLLANLSASNITIGKDNYRQKLCAVHSSRCIAAYLYACAGHGESTTDLAWDGSAILYENNELLAESERFQTTGYRVTGDIDLDRLVQERARQGSFADTAHDYADRIRGFRHIDFTFEVPQGSLPLRRKIERYPYVPSDIRERDERCYESYNIQVHGLLKRLESTGIQKIVIGVSGGLDSTHALIVAARAMDRLNLPRKNILAYTMPGFATSDRTLSNALALMDALGTTSATIDIRPSCLQMMRDLGHPFIGGEPVYDITFENVQAGERTSHLFRLANFHNALVLGTGDLSELALGWCTYGVGDHMSHYNVNASVSKTLIQYLIRWAIHSHQFDDTTGEILQSVLDTEISPELVPHSSDDRTAPSQSTEQKIGPYALNDFFLYYITRYGLRPSKVAFMALHAWGDRERGEWSPDIPLEKRPEYDLPTIRKWLESFLFRFFQISQFKRSCVPNAPKVGSGGSLSPRGDWRAPSDSSATVWLEELRWNVPE